MGGNRMLAVLWLTSAAPATLFLTASFFVLFAIRKLDEQKLKLFGYLLTAFLWISAGMVFLSGLSSFAIRRPMMPMRAMNIQRQQMSQSKMPVANIKSQAQAPESAKLH